MRQFACVAIFFALVAGGVAADSHRSGERVPPGDFDYYLLSLSWAPDYCGRPNVQKDPRECGPGRRLGFVVHGLWPQLMDGGHPSECAPARPVAHDNVVQMLALIPAEGLIQHEWRDHGTCSGLSAAAYFDLVRRAHDAIAIPPDLQAPNRRAELSPREIEAKFTHAGWPAARRREIPRFKDSFRRASCGGGWRLSEAGGRVSAQGLAATCMQFAR